MFRTALATALFLPVLAGCSDNGAAEPAASRPSEDAATVAAEAVTPAEPGRAEAVDESTDDFQFAYSWPAAAGTGPLKDALTAERQRLRNEIATSASAAAPLERVLVETDSPYLAPPPYRGKRNEPAYSAHTAQIGAEVFGLDYAAFAAATQSNFDRLFAKASRKARAA